ncbi:MAG: hypothetical protein K8R67_11460 [Desulfobacteraceae bacterium]|nr:hypothetical protein [Desulfobacteraceae bacterium]
MKLTDPGIIQEGEKDLIDAIKDDLDLDAINEVIKDKLKVKNLESKGGKIIVHNNKIAFKLDFELSLNGSLMFDRDGNYIPDSHDDGDADDSEDTIAESEVDFFEIEKEANIEKADDKKSDSEEDIAQELAAEDDPDDDETDAVESSELDLDIENSEDEEDDMDFSDDEEIGDILKESREFWEKKKK